MTALDGLVRETLMVSAVLALPAIILATVVGTAVAVVQAATQVHEQTLTLLPKLIAIGALVVAFGTFGLRVCGELFEHAIGTLPALVHGP